MTRRRANPTSPCASRWKPSDLSALTAEIELTPGMPAEVFILTGEQSLFGYFAAPVVRSFRRAFREE